MPHTPGSLIHRLAAAVGVLLVLAAPVAAQKPEPNPPETPEFMAGYDFHLEAAGLSSGDERFTWDTHWGGDVDIVDYVAGRAKVLVDYEAVLGSEFRAFDPNQGNYTLEASGSARLKGTELAFVFHHVSRHLADRPKRFAIAWNVAGVRALRQLSIGGTRIDLRAEAGKVVEHAFVDYAWTADADARVDRALRPRIGLYGRVAGNVVGVNSAESTRGAQSGGLAEAGLRLAGPGGALELFAGVERRVDADPIERVPIHWVYGGFRLVNR
jgi:hypothetical protein